MLFMSNVRERTIPRSVIAQMNVIETKFTIKSIVYRALISDSLHLLYNKSGFSNTLKRF
jgi:hypothetical protein